RRAAVRVGVDPGSFDLYEINEAFAAVAIQSARELVVGDENVNVNGGAVALGHPIGASGTRLALTLAYELRRRGGGVGAAALSGTTTAGLARLELGMIDHLPPVQVATSVLPSPSKSMGTGMSAFPPSVATATGRLAPVELRMTLQTPVFGFQVATSVWPSP